MSDALQQQQINAHLERILREHRIGQEELHIERATLRLPPYTIWVVETIDQKGQRETVVIFLPSSDDVGQALVHRGHTKDDVLLGLSWEVEAKFQGKAFWQAHQQEEEEKEG